MEEKEAIMSGQPDSEIKNEKHDVKKPSYDEVVGFVRQLNQQCQALLKQNEELKDQLRQAAGIDTRLFYLFKVLENRVSFDSDFLISVAEEVKDIMTIKPNENVDDKDQEKPDQDIKQ